MQNEGDTTPTGTSFTLIDVIDLTKESPIIGIVRSRERRDGSGSASCTTTGRSVRNSARKRNTSQNKRTKKTMHCDIGSTNEVVNLDDTIVVEEDTMHYATKADTGEAVPLTCPICLELLSSTLKPTTTRCGHIFCAKCLETFLRTCKNCPTCKSNVTLKSCTRLFL